MMTIEEYAIQLVTQGAVSCIEDDFNEDGAIADEDHEAACDLAMKIIRLIELNPKLSVEHANKLAVIVAEALLYEEAWSRFANPSISPELDEATRILEKAIAHQALLEAVRATRAP